MKNTITKSLLWLVVVALIGAGTYWFIEHKKRYPSTDDAYVQANQVQIATQISGQIKRITIKDHQRVTAGQTLLEIDPTPYQLALERAQAAVENIQDELQAGLSNVSATRALVRQQQTALALAETSLKRTTILVNKKIRPQADEDQAKANYQSAIDGLSASKSKLNQAMQSVGALDQSNAKLRMAKAQLATAEWQLNNTKITAPADGIINNFHQRIGNTISQGTPLFSLVENNHYWIDANFKETALGKLKVGQPVLILIDMYPDKRFHGEITSISPASGASMSILPAQNTSGNWVKVTQRFPVHIQINDADPTTFPLRIGASATITVDTGPLLSKPTQHNQENGPPPVHGNA